MDIDHPVPPPVAPGPGDKYGQWDFSEPPPWYMAGNRRTGETGDLCQYHGQSLSHSCSYELWSCPNDVQCTWLVISLHFVNLNAGMIVSLLRMDSYHTDSFRRYLILSINLKSENKESFFSFSLWFYIIRNKIDLLFQLMNLSNTSWRMQIIAQ